ncbi:MAG: hypothetical protein FWF51_12885, partial [Chitinivibrionia bacterium]|nr:hypothetical protein [Chitinivibrionia bacterium]
LNFLFLTKFLVACFLAFCAFGFVACSDDDDGPSVDSKVVGTWIDEDGYEMTLNSNGTYSYADKGGVVFQSGTFSASGGKLTITSGGRLETMSYRVEGNNLILSATYDGQTYESVHRRK